jgi:tRNA/rRNA methyltransferase
VEKSLLRVVLVAPRNPLNIGAAARAMSNFGFTDLRLVNPYELAFREARSAVGAGAVMAGAREFPSLAEAVADCALVVGTTAAQNRNPQQALYRLEYGARLIRRRLAGEPVALLFGSEKFGLSNEDLAHCHWLLRIPSRPEHPSMNLGQAVAVCLYELIRDSRAAQARLPTPRQATAGSLETLTSLLTEVLHESGYIHERVQSSTQLKLRRLVRRLNLSAHDVEIWLGIFRQIHWRLGRDSVTEQPPKPCKDPQLPPKPDLQGE